MCVRNRTERDMYSLMISARRKKNGKIKINPPPPKRFQRGKVAMSRVPPELRDNLLLANGCSAAANMVGAKAIIPPSKDLLAVFGSSVTDHEGGLAPNLSTLPESNVSSAIATSEAPVSSRPSPSPASASAPASAPASA